MEQGLGTDTPVYVATNLMESMLENSKRAYKKLFPNTRVTFGTFEYYTDISKALENIDFIIEPYLRFLGLPGEQKTMFFKDPFGNALEFKSFKDFNQIFAK